MLLSFWIQLPALPVHTTPFNQLQAKCFRVVLMQMPCISQNAFSEQPETSKRVDHLQSLPQHLPKQVRKWMRSSSKNLKEPVIWNSSSTGNFRTKEFSLQSIFLLQVPVAKTCLSGKICSTNSGYSEITLAI